MPSISEIIANSISGLAKTYEENVAEPHKALMKLKEELHKKPVGKEKTRALSFSQTDDIEGYSLSAIDGGRVTQQLSAGDLLVIGATAGEGWTSKQVYDSEDLPAEAWVSIVPHASSNNELGGCVMAALELLLLEQLQTDIKIIDGAYLGNVSTVLFGVINRKTSSAEQFLSIFDDDQWAKIETSMLKVLKANKDNSSRLIAVTKSDSSFVYSKFLFGEGHPLTTVISDRVLAGAVLSPGEFLTPRALESNEPLIKALDNISEHPLKDETGIIGDRFRMLTSKKVGLLRQLRSEKTDATEFNLLRTTYFKPIAWDEDSPAIKIEFFYNQNQRVSVEDHARTLIELINQDILDSGILEPWSQYEADRHAKDVSTGADIAKNFLIENANTQAEAVQFMRGYRT